MNLYQYPASMLGELNFGFWPKNLEGAWGDEQPARRANPSRDLQVV